MQSNFGKNFIVVPLNQQGNFVFLDGSAFDAGAFEYKHTPTYVTLFLEGGRGEMWAVKISAICINVLIEAYGSAPIPNRSASMDQQVLNRPGLER